MAAPLLPDPVAHKQADSFTAADRAHAERVARATAVDAALAEINRGGGRIQVAAPAHGGVPQGLFVNDHSAPVAAKKAEPRNLHPRVAALKAELSADAADLLSLVLRADEAYRGARLLDLSAFAVGQALNLTERAALAARAELEQRGLIVFRDDHSGNRGFLPRLP